MKTAEMIKNDVEQELRWEPSVCSTKIGVSVNAGVVELDGHVGSLHERWAAERAALRVAKVTAIASEIIVDLPFESERTDGDIASAASSHFTWNYLVPDTVKLKVSKGWVTVVAAASSLRVTDRGSQLLSSWDRTDHADHRNGTLLWVLCMHAWAQPCSRSSQHEE